MQQSLTSPERETVITFNDAESVAHVFTWQRTMITRLRNNPAAVETATHSHGSSLGAEFEIPKDLVSFRSKRVKRELTDEQRAALRAVCAQFPETGTEKSKREGTRRPLPRDGSLEGLRSA